MKPLPPRPWSELENEGFTVIPSARAAQLTMNREGIRRLAAEELGLPTSPYQFADSFEQCRPRSRHWLSLSDQADHELVRQGAVRAEGYR